RPAATPRPEPVPPEHSSLEHQLTYAHVPIMLHRRKCPGSHQRLTPAAHVSARSVRRRRPWMADHTLAGVSGMSACTTPNGASASTTEFTPAAREPPL